MDDPREQVPGQVARASEWLRGLARRMVADAHEADDLAQDAWVAVLERPPAGLARSGFWRGFLGGVLRNKRRQSARAAGRRRLHEERAAEAGAARTGTAAPSADEVLERAELARAVLECVLALDEPFRTVVLLRYGDAMTAAAVAERLGVPVKTVESRARRGLQRLRDAWTHAHGDERPAWLDALVLVALPFGTPALPLGAPASSGPAASAGSAASNLVTLGALTMQTKLIAGLLVAVGCAGALMLVRGRPSGAAEPSGARIAEPRTSAELVPAEIALDAPRRAGEARRERTAVAVPPGAAPKALVPSPAGSRPTRLVHGRVFDVDGRPVAGVLVRWKAGWSRDPERDAELETASAADGSFELQAPVGTATVDVDEPDLVTLVSGHVQGNTDVEVPIVVAAHRRLAGQVIDEAGLPLFGCVVVLEPPPGFLGRFDAIFDAATVHPFDARTDADGAFDLPAAPVLPGAKLVTRLDGYEPAELDAPLGEAVNLRLMLHRPRDPNALLGRVVDSAGVPAAGAWVSLGARSAVTDAAGGFALSRDGAEGSCTLSALLTGHRPARMTVERDAGGAPVWPPWIELVLGDPPLKLAGHVVDERGDPRAGVQLWIADPTPFGTVGDETGGQVEFLLAYEASPSSEDLDVYWYSTSTDVEGGFELPGLLDRDYRVRLLDVGRKESLVVGPVRAGGDDVRLVFPREPLGELKGRVVAHDGTPLEGVLLFLECETYGGVWTQGAYARTDADGEFRFEGVGNAHLSLMVRGDDVVPRWDFFDGDVRGVEREIVAERRCHLKVDLVDPASADSFHVLDAEGGPLFVFRLGAGGTTYLDSFDVIDGRSETAGVAESAATLVLTRAGEEVARVPLRLVPGELCTVLR